MAMANIGSTTVQRPIAAPPPPADSTPINGSKHPRRRNRNNFKITFPFDIPSSPEAAAARIVRNLTHFGPYYFIFVWSILAIPLLPERKVSLMILVAMTVVTCLFLQLLGSKPMVIEKFLVLALIAIVTVVGMILTKATVHFFASLAGSVPVILIHAVLREGGDGGDGGGDVQRGGWAGVTAMGWGNRDGPEAAADMEVGGDDGCDESGNQSDGNGAGLKAPADQLKAAMKKVSDGGGNQKKEMRQG